MSVATASGALYEVDTRLRPSGADGLLCASVKSFAQYQRDDAWTWEHMALTRARVLFGSADARRAVTDIVWDVLNTQRDSVQLHTDITKMRKDMAAHKPPKGPLDVKLLPGGLVDMEFIIHALQLQTHAGIKPQLAPAIDALVVAGHLPAEFAKAFALMSRLLVMIRLIAPDCVTPPEAAQLLIAHSLGFADWDGLMNTIGDYRGLVIAQWHSLFGPRDF
jgi:glutamate-ammonia-ligase adenylyltransferase